MQGRLPVLVVFANPRGTSALRLGEEDRAITEAVRRSKQRDDITLTKCHAATVHDLSRSLLDEEFRIVHVSGHGTHSGLVLEENDGSRFVVPQTALAKLFSAYASPNGPLECVILNACYSVSTGTLASLGTPYTIAMEGPISDQAAVEFSRGFYDAIGAGKDITFAYEEGCRRVELAAPGTQFVSRLLRLGESYGGIAEVEPTQNRQRALEETAPVLVGVGVDLSGSMQANMRNNSGGAISRLEGFRRSLQRTVAGINKDLRQYADGEKPSFDVFAYGFGLRHRSVAYADLFSLIKVGRDVVSPEEIDQLKEKHTREVRRQYEAKAAQYGEIADMARRYLGSFVSQVERSYRAEAEAEVRNRVLAEVADRMASRLRTLGDTTLSIQEVVDLWNQSGRAFEDAEDLIFGATPMCGALKEMKGRFERELKQRLPGTLATLFLLSDGEPTDGSPKETLEAIRGLGVTVVSCYVTDHDVAAPRTLYGQPLAGWPREARLMFDAASQLPDDSDLSNLLLRKGWSVHPNARLFVQLNHTDVLNEFMDVLALPLRQREMAWLLPVGEFAPGP